MSPSLNRPGRRTISGLVIEVALFGVLLWVLDAVMRMPTNG